MVSWKHFRNIGTLPMKILWWNDGHNPPPHPEFKKKCSLTYQRLSHPKFKLNPNSTGGFALFLSTGGGQICPPYVNSKNAALVKNI